MKFIVMGEPGDKECVSGRSVREWTTRLHLELEADSDQNWNHIVVPQDLAISDPCTLTFETLSLHSFGSHFMTLSFVILLGFCLSPSLFLCESQLYLHFQLTLQSLWPLLA